MRRASNFKAHTVSVPARTVTAVDNFKLKTARIRLAGPARHLPAPSRNRAFRAGRFLNI